MKYQHPVRTTTTVQYYLTEEEIVSILLDSMNLNPADCAIVMDEVSYGGIRGCTIQHTTVTESKDGDL